MTATSNNKHRKKIVNLASSIAQAICALPDNSTSEKLLNVFSIQKQQAANLADAFQMLDQHPAKFANHGKWHNQLRRLRNCPENGKKLFAMFA